MSEPLTPADVEAALRVIGLDVDLGGPGVVERILESVDKTRTSLDAIRSVALANDVPPAMRFVPEAHTPLTVDGEALPGDVARRIAAREVSCREVTTAYLERLHEVDEVLHCVVTFLDDRALAQAAALDDELAGGGSVRGPLHGVPWGAKDLLALRGRPTTWGVSPYRDRTIDRDAVVVDRLDQAGAVCLAKLTLGELAYGDVWFGGQTRNPWDVSSGSSGSSAGSAAATSAGAVEFAVGSETLGSIISPASVCGVSGLRPTFGLVPTDGAMALSWSMDKLGPMGRSLADCAAVMEALVPGRRFPSSIALSGLRIGVDESAFESSSAEASGVLESLRELGASLVPFVVPSSPPAGELLPILWVEAAAAFDELVRSGGVDALVRQGADSWPVLMRAARLVPAVEYVNAQRARTLLGRSMEQAFADAAVDLYVHPTWGGATAVVTNLTGQPTAVAPCPHPHSISFTGRLGADALVLAAAATWQSATSHHLPRPPV